MYRLPVNPQSSDWIAIRKALETRHAELLEECANPATDDRARYGAACRAAEVRALLMAPAETLEESIGLAAAAGSKSNVY